ncbi:hyaluronate lyase N-terminal domain-containing protein [Megasphaera cerevisiae]|uniref:hyaluronate lyase N-terminal domain-containing protein n=1 Tax=Megasphaera cerevisiae TaxID=39029 RepID=UPI00117CDCFF|nr:tail fiber protein [Megasphaera cerevisiae]
MVQHKTGTAAQWTSVNPTLAKGEIGVEIDAGRIKIGDGITAWENLPYIGQSSTAPVGHIQQQYIVESGYLALDGSTYSRVTYATLWTWAQANNLAASSPNKYQFGTGDGSTTFTVPNHIGRIWQGAATVGYTEAGIPNITGKANGLVGIDGVESNLDGCFGYSGLATINSSISYKDDIDVITGNNSKEKAILVQFDASYNSGVYGKSATVQPSTIDVIPQIKY